MTKPLAPVSASRGNSESFAISLSGALSAYLAEVGEAHHPERIESVDQAERVFRQHRQAETASRVMQGWVLACVQAMGSESLRELATRVAISRETIRQLIGYFHLFQAIPDLDKVHRLAELDFTIARELVKWQPEEQLALLGGEPVRGVTIEDAKALSTREFINSTRTPEAAALTKRIREVDTDNQTLRLRIQGLQSELACRHNNPNEPPWYLIVRQEAAACSATLTGAVSLLEDALLEHLPAPAHGSARAKKLSAAAASSVFHLLRAEHLRIQTLLSELEQSWGDEIANGLEPEFALLGDEAEQAAQRAHEIFNALEQETDHRRELQQKLIPKKPGKPKARKAARIKERAAR